MKAFFTHALTYLGDGFWKPGASNGMKQAPKFPMELQWNSTAREACERLWEHRGVCFWNPKGLGEPGEGFWDNEDSSVAHPLWFLIPKVASKHLSRIDMHSVLFVSCKTCSMLRDSWSSSAQSHAGMAGSHSGRGSRVAAAGAGGGFGVQELELEAGAASSRGGGLGGGGGGLGTSSALGTSSRSAIASRCSARCSINSTSPSFGLFRAAVPRASQSWPRPAAWPLPG